MAFEQFLLRPRHIVEHYLHMLDKLLPNGDSWGVESSDTSQILYDSYGGDPVIEDVYTGEDEVVYDTYEGSKLGATTPFGIFLGVLAAEFVRVEERAFDLIRERVPGAATELLPEWYDQTVADEYEAALVGGDLDAQRALAHGKTFIEAQVTTAEWFVEYGSSLGYAITVNETPYFGVPFRVGTGRCGEPMSSWGAISYVEIYVPVPTLESLVSQAVLQGLFNRAKPAHVIIIWNLEEIPG